MVEMKRFEISKWGDKKISVVIAMGENGGFELL